MARYKRTLHFATALVCALLIEAVNHSINQMTLTVVLEPLPAGAFLVGVLCGWPGIVGWFAGQLCHQPLGQLLAGESASPFASGDAFNQWVASPTASVCIGIVGYLTFRFGGRLGRGFPDVRSVVALAFAAAIGGLASAGVTKLFYGLPWDAFLLNTGSNVAAIFFLVPLPMLFADRYLRSALAQLPAESFPSRDFPENLEIQPSDSSVPLVGRLLLIGLAIVIATVVVMKLRLAVPQVTVWPVLVYFGLILWGAFSYGLRGGLLASSTVAVCFLSAHSYIGRDTLPDSAFQAPELYAEFAFFYLIAAVLGAGRETEVHLRQQMLMRDRMSELLQAAGDLQEAYRIIERGLGRILPGTRGELFTLEQENVLKRVACWGDPTRDAEVFSAQDCWALRRGQVHFVDSRGEGARCAHLGEDVTSSVCFPLVAQSETLGVLQLEAENRDEIFVQSLARIIALSLGNIRAHLELKDQSIRDALTGLFNRRYLVEQLELEVSRAQRDGQLLGLMIADIDHFKRFNDTWGHEAGDEVLRQVGAYLTANARQGDIVCRWGGEEFVLVLTGAPLSAVERRAEELREGLRQLRPRNAGQSLGQITASFGVACWPLHGDAWRHVLEQADFALYEAKKSGRDKVVLAPTPEQPLTSVVG